MKGNSQQIVPERFFAKNLGETHYAVTIVTAFFTSYNGIVDLSEELQLIADAREKLDLMVLSQSADYRIFQFVTDQIRFTTRFRHCFQYRFFKLLLRLDCVG